MGGHYAFWPSTPRFYGVGGNISTSGDPTLFLYMAYVPKVQGTEVPAPAAASPGFAPGPPTLRPWVRPSWKVLRVRRGVAAVRLHCRRAVPCRGTASLHPGGRSKSFRLPAGGARTVGLAVGRRLGRRLRGKRTARARLTVADVDAATGPRTEAYGVRLRAAPTGKS